MTSPLEGEGGLSQKMTIADEGRADRVDKKTFKDNLTICVNAKP